MGVHPYAPPGDEAKQERTGSNSLKHSGSGPGPRVPELAGATGTPQAVDLTLTPHNRVLTQSKVSALTPTYLGRHGLVVLSSVFCKHAYIGRRRRICELQE